MGVHTSLLNGSILPTVQSQPWWGDQSIAQAVSDEVQFNLGGDNPSDINGSGGLAAVVAYADAPGNNDLEVFQWHTSTGAVDKTYWKPSGSWRFIVSNGCVKSEQSGLAPSKHTTAPDLIPSNVPTCGGSKFVSGFQIVGNGGVTWYTDAKNQSECFDGNVHFLPVGINSWDTPTVLAYLGGEFDVYTRGGSTRKVDLGAIEYAKSLSQLKTILDLAGFEAASFALSPVTGAIEVSANSSDEQCDGLGANVFLEWVGLVASAGPVLDGLLGVKPEFIDCKLYMVWRPENPLIADFLQKTNRNKFGTLVPGGTM